MRGTHSETLNPLFDLRANPSRYRLCWNHIMKPDSSLSSFIRACLIIAIIAGTVSTVNVVKLRGTILTLHSSVETTTAARENAQRELIRTQQSLEHAVAALEE